MLNSRKYAVLTAMLSAAGLLPMSAMADISFAEGGERLINTLHTHLYSPSLGLSSSDEIKTAAVCFISDTKNCSDGMFGYGEEVSGGSGSGGVPDYDLNDAERCRKEGYTLTSCAAGETPEGFCIYNSNYFARCVCPSGYKTCEPPYYGVGQACGDKYASCEEDTERACKELDSEFTDTCQSGWKVDPNNACEYDVTYGKCCNLCEGYDYTTIPEGYIADGDACVDCDGVSKYKIKINPCDGFQDCGVMGGDTGAKTCMSGSQIKYDNCKPCPNLGTLSSCPSPFTCTYEECSNRYYKSGCQSGYDWNASAQTCTPQCANTYQYTCTGTNQTGGSGAACGGKYTSCTCSSGYIWNGGKCNKIENACMRGSQLGYILNSDMTVTSSKQSGKTPIGVVVCSYSGGGGQAMALKSLGNYKWSTEFVDISSLTSYTSSLGLSQNVASCENSAKIRAQGNSSTYPAVWAAYNYSTEGTKAGDWCLPSAGIFALYYSNQSTIDTGFSRAGGTQFTTSTRAWSSSEYNKSNAWFSNFNYSYGMVWNGKHNTNEVRPVIGFCQSEHKYDKATDTCKYCGNTYQYTCNGMGYAGGSGTACGGKYTACTCSSGYAWNGSSCAFQNACMEGSQLGYILNSDMTVTSTTQSGKTPIGVVVCSYSGGGGQAMALKSLGNYGWSTEIVDISGLTNVGFLTAPRDVASCENSAIIRAQGDSSTYPAVWAAYNYSTEGTKVGDWCLPAAGIFTSIYNNQSTINTGFSRAGGTQFTTSTSAWSSSEDNYSYAWFSYFNYNYGMDWIGKSHSYEVRPVIEF